MGARQRAAIYAVLGVLWVSGCLWLMLDEFFASPGQFGTAQHPWQPPILLVHGVVALFAMYLLGWVSARHVLRWWPGRLRRWSGGTLAACLTLLVVSGFALFFLERRPLAARHRAVARCLGSGASPFSVFSTGSLPSAASCAVPPRSLDNIPGRRRWIRTLNVGRRHAPVSLPALSSRLMRNTPASTAVAVSQSIS